MLQGKSVGFVRLKSHAPSSHEIAANPALAEVSRVIDEWLLIEYACTFLPMNQSALVEAVSKSAVKAAALRLLGVKLAESTARGVTPRVIPFTPEAEILRAVERRLLAFDFKALAKTAIANGIGRTRGRV